MGNFIVVQIQQIPKSQNRFQQQTKESDSQFNPAINLRFPRTAQKKEKKEEINCDEDSDSERFIE